MLKSWICRLKFAFLLVPLALYPFETGVQASRSIDLPEFNPNRQSIEVSQSNLPPGFQIVSIASDSLVLDIQSPFVKF